MKYSELKYILIYSILLFFLANCDDEFSDNAGGKKYVNEEMLVDFNIQWPDDDDTRAFENGEAKTHFEDGDVIHVIGTFKTKALQSDGSYIYGLTSRYGALGYNGKNRQWEALSGNELTWPSIATEGTFYAYYVNGVNGIITEYDKPEIQTLSSITAQSDPLMAPNTGYIIYGHAVNLKFNHLCAHLTLIDLMPNVAQNYFFTTDNIKDPETKDMLPFNNAFQLSLVKNEGFKPDGTPTDSLKGLPSLKFEFIEQTDTVYKDLIYISGATKEEKYIDEAGNEKVITKAGFFLEPGLYETFKLLYPALAPSTYEYLTYNYNSIPDNYGDTDYDKIEPNLEAGTTYTLTITKSPGVTIEVPPPGDGWDDDTDPVTDIDVEEFLRAVNEGKEYVNKEGTKILESTAEGTKLLHNVDFNGFSYKDFSTLAFLPDVQQDMVFDGDYHYISNLGSPLFRNNYGTIKNIGLKGVVYEADSYEYTINDDDDEVNNTQDRSRHGALCMWNRGAATISNVRVSDVSITINVIYNNTDDDGNEVHNIGGLVGSNTGKISEVALDGKFNIKVKSNYVQNAQVLIGGITGQNAGAGNIYDVSIENFVGSQQDKDFEINIINECKGAQGLYAIGGIVGSSSSTISGVVLSNITVDSTESEGEISYIGGMAGQLESTNESPASLRSCILSGTVKAGVTGPYKVEEGQGNQGYTINGQSYIGGMVGIVSNVPVEGCRSTVNVIGADSQVQDVIYGTGGGFGRISSGSQFQNLIIYGSYLTVPTGSTGSNYGGNFTGIAPIGQTWESDYANKNIILHVFGELNNIGTNLE